LIQIEDLKVCYGKDVVLDNLSFTIAQGEIYGLVGPNGGIASAVSVLDWV